MVKKIRKYKYKKGFMRPRVRGGPKNEKITIELYSLEKGKSRQPGRTFTTPEATARYIKKLTLE